MEFSLAFTMEFILPLRVAGLIFTAYKNTNSYTPTRYKKFNRCFSITFNTFRIMACAISTLRWAGEKNDPTLFRCDLAFELIIFTLGQLFPNIKETTCNDKKLDALQKKFSKKSAEVQAMANEVQEYKQKHKQQLEQIRQKDEEKRMELYKECKQDAEKTERQVKEEYLKAKFQFKHELNELKEKNKKLTKKNNEKIRHEKRYIRQLTEQLEDYEKRLKEGKIILVEETRNENE